MNLLPDIPTPHLADLPVAGRRNDREVELIVPEGDAPLDFARIFGRARELELEVGSGKGRFVLLAATARPDVDFVGVEYARKFYLKALDRVAKRDLANVRLINNDVFPLLRSRFASACFAAVHVYFPDPWPKKRHHKRRFFRDEVLDDVARVLRPGGLLRAATDHPLYAAAIREVMAARTDFEDAGPDQALWELPGMGDYTTLGVTNFEIKYRREGRPIHRFAWRRR